MPNLSDLVPTDPFTSTESISAQVAPLRLNPARGNWTAAKLVFHIAAGRQVHTYATCNTSCPLPPSMRSTARHDDVLKRVIRVGLEQCAATQLNLEITRSPT